MIDKSIIKENFSRMSDTELINLAENEGHDLTPEALTILQEVFANRKLDMSVFGTVADNKVIQQQQNIEKAQAKGEDEYLKSLWLYVFEEKKAGKTDKEIKAGIINGGLNEEEASEMIETLESKAKEVLHAHDTNIWLGGFICTAGIVITLWSYSAAFAGSGGTYVIAWGAIVFGAIRFIKGISNRAKYKTIVSKIQSERSKKHNSIHT